MSYTTIDTKFDPAKQPIPINAFQGSYNDPKSRIWPFKRMHTLPALRQGQQHPRLHAPLGRGQGRLLGQLRLRPRHRSRHEEQNDIPYSGQYGFIETDSYWPITHMVAPKETGAETAANATPRKGGSPRCRLLHARPR